MPKPRRKPPRTVFLPRLVVPGGMGLLLTLCAFGFVYFTRITLDKQAHFAPDSAHPWDGYAAACLFLGLLALAGLLLSLRDPPPMRWRRAPRGPGSWSRSRAARGAKRRRGSGTIGKQ